MGDGLGWILILLLMIWLMLTDVLFVDIGAPIKRGVTVSEGSCFIYWTGDPTEVSNGLCGGDDSILTSSKALLHCKANLKY